MHGNLVVGLIVFAILVTIQFVVIASGSQRVAEVAARFTLDAMPGKQMAIDADVHAGAIDARGARAANAPTSNAKPISTVRWTARESSSRAMRSRRS